MHYTLYFENNTPPWGVRIEHIDAASKEEALKKHNLLHPYNDYPDYHVFKVDECKQNTTKENSNQTSLEKNTKSTKSKNIESDDLP